MSLTINLYEEEPMNRVANQRLYLTADKTRVVTEGDPGAASLLAAGDGDEIPVEYADLDIDPGFLQSDDEPDDNDDTSADEDAPASKPKQASKPANKAVKKTANKSA